MFTDMVGFTAWSSQRSPADVFTLLETCYGAFDTIAHRRGIFKVETIGSVNSSLQHDNFIIETLHHNHCVTEIVTLLSQGSLSAVKTMQSSQQNLLETYYTV